MANKIKSILTSEKGMKIINLLFLLSMLIRNCGIIFIAYTAWIIYLLYCIKNTSSKMIKIAYRLFIAFAAIMIFLNITFMLKGA